MITQSTLQSAIATIFGTGLSQHARLITLETAQTSDLPETLVVERFSGREAVNELFCFNIEALSVSTQLDLKQFIGEEITLWLLQADGSRRAWHGYCTEAAWLGADGGVARYSLKLEPFLAFLKLRRDSFIFQDKNVQDIVTELLADYSQANFKFEVTQFQTIRPICTQYREDDLAFFTRLLASEGLNWRFEHEQDSDTSSTGNAGKAIAHAKHQLIIFDAKAAKPAMPGGADIRFHGVRATEAEDGINQFGSQRQIQSNAVSVASWDYTQVSAPAAEHASSLNAGELPMLSVYNGSGERYFTNTSDADQHSDLTLQALESFNKTFSGAGAVRQLTAGHAFHLTQHEHYPLGTNEFTVLWVEHDAANNLDASVATLSTLNNLERGTYRNRFSSVRESVPLVPSAMVNRRAPTATGAQVALVVGMENAPLTTERDHRIKIQFAWQRGNKPNTGGLTETGAAGKQDDHGNAPNNETSGTWVRVAETLAGPNWGTVFTPRIGSEVLVDFIEGDMDRPVIVAQLFNGSDLPPYSAGVDSGVNHAGVLSGLHSHNLDGAGEGYNQWVVDDSQNQLRMRLATSTAASQLNLGYLVSQSPDSAHRGSYRGNGFELRTDAWGVVRAGAGLLVSTSARNAQGTSVASTQLDASEAIAQLKGAAELSKVLCEAATHQSALSSKAANKGHADLITSIDPAQKGHYAGSVNGQTAQKSVSGTKSLDAAQPVEQFATPVVLLDSPTSINFATPASTVMFAGEQIQWTSQSDMHLAAAHTVAGVSGNATSLFTHAGGIQAFAANGPVSLQAHTDQLEILADKAVTLISVNDKIEIMANTKITLQAGQSSITLDGGNITFACPGTFSVKGANHPFGGGGSKAAELGILPNLLVNAGLAGNLDSGENLFDEAFVVLDPNGNPMGALPYSIKSAGGKYFAETDTEGNSLRTGTVASEPVTFALQWHEVSL
ncbi:type VI secretion system Vgr family protein [Sulfurirhabdus autotrophica]|uniref:Type VI secretion system secreted protein VgrG n=1 Tax=Sulfurirhabdus autotrophica TaxID=1706046 RepID=A0A4R3YI63_9PROT|nr:type VI secretion system tip protein TssI/VgrG [Sulfurirhabdus autotrophica]TCV90684.1 type VI secretion system secreted protein VgrG [Sulfurirhabdus autotrophica]